MAEADKPEIELYMYSMNQEFPVTKGHATFLKRHEETFVEPGGRVAGIRQLARQGYRLRADDWSVQWISNEWIENYTYYPGAGLVEHGDPIQTVMARQEDFGGILFDRINDRVYKVNPAGYRLFQEIVEWNKEKPLAGFRSRSFKEEDVTRFVSFLKGAGLWRG
jgi:hypothetical protein